MRSYYQFSPVGVSVALVLYFLHSLTLGISFLILIPLLQLSGIYDDQNHTRSYWSDLVSELPKIDVVSVLLIYFLLITAISLFRFIANVTRERLEERFLVSIRSQVFQSIFSLAWIDLLKKRRSYLHNALTTQVQLAGNLAKKIPILVFHALNCVLLATVSMLLSWKLSILALTCSTSVLLLYYGVNQSIYRRAKNQNLSFKEIFSEVSNMLAGAKYLKAHNREENGDSIISSLGEKLSRHNLHIAYLREAASFLTAVFGVVIISGLFYISYTYLQQSAVTFVLLIVIFSRIWRSLGDINNAYLIVLSSLPPYEELRAILNSSKDESKVQKESLIVEPRMFIRFDNIGFGYGNDRKRSIFSELNLKVVCKSVCMITGKSGTGKSTIADILAGLLTPDFGVISFDGHQVTLEHSKAWKKIISYIPQDNFLINDSIKNNILLLCTKPESISDDEINKVLQDIHADFVFALPQGIDTHVGDNGVQFSGGQKQLLALARALITKPRFLIMDEATSAVDSVTERKIGAFLRKLSSRTTIIIIAHRSELVNFSDHIIELENTSPLPLKSVTQ